jgi:hypothetical protein
MRQGEGTMHYHADDDEDEGGSHHRHGFWNKDKLEGMVEYTKGHHTQKEFW